MTKLIQKTNARLARKVERNNVPRGRLHQMIMVREGCGERCLWKTDGNGFNV